MRRFLVLTIAIIVLLFVSAAKPVLALQAIGAGAAPGCELQNGDVPSFGCLAVVISNVISIGLMFVGSAALIYLLYGSLRFIISRGDPKAIDKAKKTMTYAIYGVLAVCALFLVVSVLARSVGIPNPLENFSVYVP